MDVPISIGVMLATGMSLYETITGGAHTYFDSSAMLLFFLLIGRYLDLRARGQARSAAEQLLGFMAQPATVIGADGAPQRVPAACGRGRRQRAGRRRASASASTAPSPPAAPPSTRA